MSDTIVSFGVEKLWELVSQEYELLQGVDEQVIELKSDLNMLMSFLKDADAKKQTSALARNCVEEIKEITYDAEDMIETFLLKEKGRSGSGIKNLMRSLACIPGGRKEIALEITSISKRISKVIHVMQTFGIQPIIDGGGYSQAIQERTKEMRHTFSSKYESNIVGLEKNVDKLVGYLLEEDSSQVVSITGLGGLGKTTLARHVFNHDKIKHHFDGLAWVCVSKEFTLKHLWQTILRNLSPGDKNKSGDKDLDMPIEELQEKLVQLLEIQKALIVFDDIWTKEDWDTIKPMFPESNATGWKVLLTSRNDDVHPQCFNLKPDILSAKECWTLLRMIAFSKNDTTRYHVDKEMVKMAKEMIKHCGGLPLAVRVLGGVLASQRTLREWKNTYNNGRSHIVRGISSLNGYDSISVYHVLSLSFEGLPVYLKHCLLHLASFPEDYKIDLENLSYYWAADGISKPENYERASYRDVSDVYIEELLKRNMVISERDFSTSRFETCQLHDVMREICLMKAKDENFLQIVTTPTSSSGTHSQASSKSRRLVVHCSSTFNGKREIKNSKLRSLLFIPEESTPYPMESDLCFVELQFMRVLDLTRAQFKGKKLPSNIGKFIHLRYFCLYDTRISQLPSSLGNLKMLLYLNLRVFGLSPIHVPNVLKEMQELRYLCLPKRMHGKTKLEMSNLVKLETLKNFSTMHGNVTDLQGMTKLITLTIFLNGGCSLGTLSSSLAKLKHLENLSLHDDRTDVNKDVSKGFVLDCINLNNLDLTIYMPRLPEEQPLPCHLTTITLTECFLEDDPMAILGMLLHLKEVTLWSRSFCKSKTVCLEGGFPKLQKLELGGVDDWEEWIVEKGSIPFLHTLTVWDCQKLKKLPDGLRFITSLNELIIYSMEREFTEKLSRGREDHYKIQNIPFVRISHSYQY